MLIFCTKETFIKSLQKEAVSRILVDLSKQERVQRHIIEVTKRENEKRRYGK